MNKEPVETEGALKWKQKMKQGHQVIEVEISPPFGKNTSVKISSHETDKIKTHNLDDTYFKI